MLEGDTLTEEGAALLSFRLEADGDGRQTPGFQSSDPDMAPGEAMVRKG